MDTVKTTGHWIEEGSEGLCPFKPLVGSSTLSPLTPWNSIIGIYPIIAMPLLSAARKIRIPF
jgi:hypothetical protein